MGMVSRRWVWAESMGVVLRRYRDFLILLIPTPLVSRGGYRGGSLGAEEPPLWKNTLQTKQGRI